MMTTMGNDRPRSKLKEDKGSPAEDRIIEKYSTEVALIDWLKKSDYEANYLEVLGNSIYVKNGQKIMSKKQFFKKFDKIFPLKKDSLKIVVIKDKSSGMCFGTGSIFIDKNRKTVVSI